MVVVENGEVTLAGRVPERWMQLEIEHDCLQVEGVKMLVSHVTAPAPKTSPK